MRMKALSPNNMIGRHLTTQNRLTPLKKPVVFQLYSLQYKSIFGAPDKVRCNGWSGQTVESGLRC
jgi:hypothetical protein